MILEISKDNKTGFPCVRESGQGEFVALFPVTKIQVEQCISAGCFSTLSPDGLKDMITRFVFKEICTTEHGRPVYPEKILKIGRQPIGNIDKNNVANIVATNLTLWKDNKQLYSFASNFPTNDSEWGIVMTYLGGKMPSEEEWDNILTIFSRIKTNDILNAVINSGIIWPDTVKLLLEKYSETLSYDNSGLPFQNRAFYELTKAEDGKSPLARHANGQVLNYKLPNVVGDTDKSLWPAIGNTGTNRNHSVLNEFVPVVALRIWYNDNNVHSGIDSAKGYYQKEIEIHNIQDSFRHNKLQKVKLKMVATQRNTMQYICPICYNEISPDVFLNNKPLWHGEKLEEQDDKFQTIIFHSNKRPETDFVQRMAMHADYLDIARNDSSRVNSVTLSGWQRMGKTCYMLSTLAMHLYPKGKSYLEKFFPKKWNISNQRCHMYGLNNDDLLKEIENAFIQGILPNRTTDLSAAFRTPIKYKIDHQSQHIFGMRNKNERILTINDIAGETVANPDRLESDKRLHVKLTSDIIFIHPAKDVQNSIDILDRFISGFGAIQYKDDILSSERKKINFIFVLNQIDDLDPLNQEEKELLDIILTEPYQLPQKNDEDEFISYFDSMKIVHNGLKKLIETKYPDLINLLKEFNSVRFCGLSSFGFMPVLEPRRSITELHDNYLPFIPQPIRIMDPIFWILYDNNFFKF